MKVATILGIPYLYMEKDNDYHLCLAHLLAHKEYADFFRERARHGDQVIMDNGVVETGLPMPWSLLKELADDVEATDLILPDKLYDSRATLEMGKAAIKEYDGYPSLTAVPQGRNFNEWKQCLREMLEWPAVTTIGISKFVGLFTTSRVDVLKQVPELMESDMGIHLLGCISISDEPQDMEKAFPDRIWGIDSGIATICTQAGMRMTDFVVDGGRLDIPLDFFTKSLDLTLLYENVAFWRALCTG